MEREQEVLVRFWLKKASTAAHGFAAAGTNVQPLLWSLCWLVFRNKKCIYWIYMWYTRWPETWDGKWHCWPQTWVQAFPRFGGLRRWIEYVVSYLNCILQVFATPSHIPCAEDAERGLSISRRLHVPPADTQHLRSENIIGVLRLFVERLPVLDVWDIWRWCSARLEMVSWVEAPRNRVLKFIAYRGTWYCWYI